MWSDNASCYQIPTRCYGVPFEQHIFRFGLFLCRNHKGQNLVSTCCFEEPTHMHRQLRVLMWSDNSPDAHRALQLAHQEENSLGLAKYIYIYMAFCMFFFTTTELVRTFQIMIDIFPFFFDLINTYHHPSLLVSHHLLSIPLAPEVHFLGSSCRSSYSCCQFFKVEINSPWKAISTAQGSFCCFGLHWVCSKWSNTRGGEQSFRYFFCSWRQLFANALLGCEFQNNKNTSEDYKHKPKYLRTQKKHKSRQRCHHPKALKGIKSSGH